MSFQNLWKAGVSVCRGCRNRVLRVGGWVRARTLSVSALEAGSRDGGVSGAGALEPSGLVDGAPFFPSPYASPSVSLRLISYKDTRQNGLGWTLMTSQYLITLRRPLSPNTITC